MVFTVIISFRRRGQCKNIEYTQISNVSWILFLTECYLISKQNSIVKRLVNNEMNDNEQWS